MEKVSNEPGEECARTIRLADIPDIEARLEQGRPDGVLMFDPIVPREKLAPVVEALSEARVLHTVCLVEGYLRPQYKTGAERFIGAEAIISYINTKSVEEGSTTQT